MKRSHQLLSEGRRFVYWLDRCSPHPDRETYRVSIVFENESGHFPTGDDKVAPWYWDEETCQKQNEKLGYSWDEVHKILCSSMFGRNS